MTRPAEMALAVADIRIMGRAGGRAEETGTVREMQGSSSPALPLLYSTAVTVRFFDAASLALFACQPGLVLFLKERRFPVFNKVFDRKPTSDSLSLRCRSGERTRLACAFRRLAEKLLTQIKKVVGEALRVRAGLA